MSLQAVECTARLAQGTEVGLDDKAVHAVMSPSGTDPARQWRSRRRSRSPSLTGAGWPSPLGRSDSRKGPCRGPLRETSHRIDCPGLSGQYEAGFSIRIFNVICKKWREKINPRRDGCPVEG